MTKKTYNQLSAELDEVLGELQRDDIDLDNALKQYEQAMQLIKQLEKELETVENTITKIKAKFEDA